MNFNANGLISIAIYLQKSKIKFTECIKMVFYSTTWWNIYILSIVSYFRSLETFDEI